MYGEFYQNLPDPKDLFPEVKVRNYTSRDLIAGKIETERNKQELWRLVANIALSAKVFLSKAQAFHEAQRSITDERLHFILLLEKVDTLNSAIHAIAKMRDLHIRVINEALGAVPFKITLKNGKKTLTRVLSEVLKHRNEIKEIGDLDEQHLKGLEEIAEKLKTSATADTKACLKYRNRLVHEEPESVDDPRLYPQLESRAWTSIVREGVVVGRTKGVFNRKVKPDWYFEDLFTVIVNVFEHYLSTLRSLRELETFKP